MSHRSLACRVMLVLALLVGFAGVAPLGALAQGPGAAPPDLSATIAKAAGYLATQQIDGGGVDSFASGAADPTGTALAVLALASVGETSALPGMAAYLAANAAAYTHQAGHTGAAYLFPSRAGLLLTAVSAAGVDPHDVGGLDLLGELAETYDAQTGAYGTAAAEEFTSGAASDVSQAWALLGLASAGAPVPAKAAEYLLSLQGEEGSWAAGDPDTTARALTALLASGHLAPTSEAVARASGYFRITQLANGGWRPAWDEEPLNADTTGWVIQALEAAGYAPVAASWATEEGDPLSALAGLQQDGGQIGGAYANAYSTAEALLGLSGRPVYALGQNGRVARALSWLAARQDADGAWAGFSGPDAGATAEAILAFAAAGYDAALLQTGSNGASAVDYVTQAVAGGYAKTSPAAAGKVTVALVAAGSDPHDVGGVDLVDLLASEWYSPTLSAFGTITDTTDAWAQAWPILGLVAAGSTVPEGAVETLVGLQTAEGNWTDAWGYSAPDSTGLALQALAAAERPATDPAVAAGVAYLRGAQDARGGWENANSTAGALQGLLAVGEDPASPDWQMNGQSPFEALAALQKADGPFVWMWDSPFGPAADDVLATSQAIPALLGVHYPLAPAVALAPFEPLLPGPDPDRLLALEPFLQRNDDLTLVAPFGSDVNGDALLEVNYRPLGASDWITGTAVVRGQGVFTAALELSEAASYELQVTVSDPDGVQHEGKVQPAVAFSLTSEAGAPAAPPAAAAAGDRVGLVVRIDEDRVEVRTVPYKQGMTGLDVLLSSGLEVEAAYSSLGAAVCSIAGQGCAATDCFCESPDTWSYWHLQDGKWAYSPVGAATYRVKPGDVQGWSWGNAAPPPLVPLDTIFVPASEPAAPTATATPGPATAVPESAPEGGQPSTWGAAPYVFGGFVVLLLGTAILWPLLRRRRRR